MGRILSRYICREIVPPFLLGLLIFTFVLFTARIIKLVELVVNRGVSVLQIVKIFLYVMPAFLEITVPMAFLLGLLWGLGRLSADREIIALKSCGISLYQMTCPIAFVTVFVVGCTFLLTLYVRPWSNASLKELLYEVTKTHATAGLKEKTFHDDFEGLVIYAEEIQPPGTLLRGIMIADSRDEHRKNILFAPRGLVITNERNHMLTLRLLDGTMSSAGVFSEGYQTTHFSIYDVTLNLALALAAEAKTLDHDPQDMSLKAIRAVILQEQLDDIARNTARVELHRRFALPFACVVFVLIALPLSMQQGGAFRSHGFSTSLCVIFVYYLLLTAGEALGRKGTLPPAIALWLPNAVLGSIGLYLFYKTAREKRSFILFTWRGRMHQVKSPTLIQPTKT